MTFPNYQQLDAMDCGPTCLRMIAKYYGKSYTVQELREKSFITREGVSMLGISDAAESIGFKTLGAKITFEKLANEVPLPCIVHWKQNHFVVVYKVQRKKVKGKRYRVNGSENNPVPSTLHRSTVVHVADPAHGLVKYTEEEFLSGWLSTRSEGQDNGIALLLEPTNDFYEHDGEKADKQKISYFFIEIGI